MVAEKVVVRRAMAATMEAFIVLMMVRDKAMSAAVIVLTVVTVGMTAIIPKVETG